MPKLLSASRANIGSAFVWSSLFLGSLPAGAEPLLRDIGDLGGGSTIGEDVNESGQVVGGSLDGDERFRAFLYSDGTMTDLGTLGGSNSAAIDINDAGQILGIADLSTCSGMPCVPDESFFLYDGTMIDLGIPHTGGLPLGAINAAGRVAAGSKLYAGGVLTDLGSLGGGETVAVDLNDAGQVAGFSSTGSARHAFRYSGGVLTDLGTLGGTDSEACAINASGQVAGISEIAGDTETHAFLYDGTMIDLGRSNHECPSINDAGVVAFTSFDEEAKFYDGGVTTTIGAGRAYAINAAGSIAGYEGSSAFLYMNGVSIDLGAFDDDDSIAHAVSDSHRVLGQSIDTGGTQRAFLHTAGCPEEPSPSCLVAAKASLQLTRSNDAAKSQIKWKWSGGPAIAQSELGDPLQSTNYRVCVYDSDAVDERLVAAFAVSDSELWRDKAPAGFAFKGQGDTQDGTRKLQIKAGADGKSRADFQARGAMAPLPEPFSETAQFEAGTSVTVQLRHDSGSLCLSSAFTIAKQNDAEAFKASLP